MNICKLKRLSGFTLVELLIAISIAAILIAMSVPAFRSMVQNNRATTDTNRFLSTMILARSEAIKRNRAITVLSTNGTANWNGGWQIFVDMDASGAFNDDGDTTLCESTEDCMLKNIEALEGNTTLNETGNATSFTYAPSGAASSTLTFQLRVPDCTGDQGRNIRIDLTGRPNTETVAC